MFMVFFVYIEPYVGKSFVNLLIKLIYIRKFWSGLEWKIFSVLSWLLIYNLNR